MNEAGKRIIQSAKEAHSAIREEELYLMFVYELATELMNEALHDLKVSGASKRVSRNFPKDLAAAMTAIAQGQHEAGFD